MFTNKDDNWPNVIIFFQLGYLHIPTEKSKLTILPLLLEPVKEQNSEVVRIVRRERSCASSSIQSQIQSERK